MATWARQASACADGWRAVSSGKLLDCRRTQAAGEFSWPEGEIDAIRSCDVMNAGMLPLGFHYNSHDRWGRPAHGEHDHAGFAICVRQPFDERAHWRGIRPAVA